MVHGFLGNHKAENYVKLVANIAKTFSKKDCRVSFKVHMLDSNLDQFMENMGAYSEKLANVSIRIYSILNVATQDSIINA